MGTVETTVIDVISMLALKPVHAPSMKGEPLMPSSLSGSVPLGLTFRQSVVLTTVQVAVVLNVVVENGEGPMYKLCETELDVTRPSDAGVAPTDEITWPG